MIEHVAPISGIAAFGRKYVATAGYDNRLILWDALSKKAVARALHDHLANQCTFSPDGQYLASASSDYTARLWRVPDLKLMAVLPDHRDDVEMVVFHPSRALVATASRDHHVRVYDLDGRLKARLEGHTADVISVMWVGSDELLSSSDDGTVKRWNIEMARLVEDIDLNGVETDTIALSSSGVIFAGNDEGQIVVIDRGDVRHIQAHLAGIKRLATNREGTVLASLSYDRTAKIWDVSPAGELTVRAKTSFPADIWPRSCAFLGNTELVFGTFGSSYATYNFERDQWNLDSVRPTLGHNAVIAASDAVYSVGDAGIVFRNGREKARLGSLCNFLVEQNGAILSGGQLGKIFDVNSGETLYQHRSPINCGAGFGDGSRRAVIGTYTGEGLIFRPDGAGKLVYARTIDLHNNAIKGVACSDRLIFSVCATGAAAFHSMDDFRCVKMIPKAHDRIANGCTALPNGRFASISRDRHLRIWTDMEPESYPTPHTHSIKCIASSRDGRYLATGSYSGTVAIFDVATREWASVQRPTASGISSLASDGSPQGFLASSYDGNVYTLGADERDSRPLFREVG